MSDILVNMLKKEKKRAADAVKQLEGLGHTLPRSDTMTSEGSLTNGNHGDSSLSWQRTSSTTSSQVLPSSSASSAERQRHMKEKEEKTKQKICKLYQYL